MSGTRKDLSVWEKYIDCMMNGLSIRKTAVACGIHRNTAFLWRHKILDALQNMADDVTLEGIIEADETFFAISYKGNHNKSKAFAMPRKAHKRGHSTHIRGLSSDLQQQIGRIERQGNQNSVVHVFNYVTKGSFDTYLYQTLKAKQRFIGQIMTSKTPARTCEDVDQQALNYSEIKALCTGDERIKEKMMLDNEVKELNLLKVEHTNMVFDMQQTVVVTPAKIEKAEKRLENLKADRETLRQIPIDEETKLPVFRITIVGTEYTDRKEAAQALEDAVLDFVKKSFDNEKKIGKFQGFKLSVKTVMFGNEPDVSVTMKGNAEHKCALTSSFSANLKRMESTLYKIDQTINDTQNSINKLKMDLENAMRIVNTPFPQQTELEEKTERLTALTEELNQAAMEATKNAPEKQRTCYFEMAKLKKGAFKDRQKTTKPKERSQDKNEIE